MGTLTLTPAPMHPKLKFAWLASYSYTFANPIGTPSTWHGPYA